MAPGPNLSGPGDPPHYQQVLQPAQIDQAILDNGGVLVYAKISNNVYQLNLYASFENNVYSYVPSVGKIQVDTYVYDTSQPDPSVAAPTQLRYLTITGPTAMAMQAKHINPANYNEVSKYFNLGN